MRRALIGIFLATAMATPLAAQETNETDVREAVRERAPIREDVEARSAPSQERMERREERQSSREAREPEARREPLRRQDRADQPAERTDSSVSRREGVQRTLDRVFGTRDRDDRQEHRRGDRRDHRETHRDYRRDHDALHRNNPTPGEHRRFHRDVNRDHNRWHERWDHNWRRDSRYDWERYRYSNRGQYRLGRYDSPYRGYRYRPLSIGIRLGSGFYSHPYWINDPWRYRLPQAYAGTRWVRYYDDVVLVDLFTGQVVDVIYNFFW